MNGRPCVRAPSVVYMFYMGMEQLYSFKISDYTSNLLHKSVDTLWEKVEHVV